MNTTKKTGMLAGVLAAIGGLFKHLWSHGVAEEVTSMAVGGAKFLRKKVGETTEDAKTNTADDDLWDMVLQIADWKNLNTTAKDVRKYCHFLKNKTETHDYGCALVLFIAKKMVGSFERWEKTHETQQSKSGKKGNKKSSPPQPSITKFAPYIEGIELSSLWLNDLMEVPEEDRIPWMKHEGVFDLISSKKPSGFFVRIWQNKLNILLWAIFIGSLIVLYFKKTFA